MCLLLSLIWLVVPPSGARESGGAAGLVERFGHSLAWVLLAATAAVFTVGGPRRLWEATAVAAGVVYGAFVLAVTF